MEAKGDVRVSDCRKLGEVIVMNGVVELWRSLDVTVFELRLATAFDDEVTLAGYCPISNELKPCQWTIISTAGSDAP